MPTFAHPETFSIVTQTVIGVDGDGNDVYGPVETPATGAFAPAGSTELIQGETVVLTHDTIYLTDGEPVPTANDKIRARGNLYSIDGEPEVYHNPFTGYEPGAVLRLLKVT